ncbi:calcium-translocating P-type ATPase, SERCA-type [Proteinivorax tanatarense]|uniref:Calcium-translocating P-type ATPase, SERCA-type n=1 Tax=Proteinivorax tanatarense TaxID=1260629 RepID=A0AAU7VPV3_9FIRM
MNNVTNLDLKKLKQRLASDFDNGLSQVTAKNRLRKDGYNVIKQQKSISPIGLFIDQFKDAMVIVLIFATLISGLLGEYYDGITIIIIIILNAILGFVQEFKAEKSLQALAKMTSPKATVVREGKEIKIDSSELIVGDLVVLLSGDKVPADIRLVESQNLEIDESALTGESVPVIKNANKLVESSVVSDAVNCCFMGTSVTKGKAKGVVFATGMKSAMGQVAHMIDSEGNDATPLQNRLNQLGKVLVSLCLLVSFLVVLLGIYRGEDIYKMFLAGVSLAVAAIPEGLPAIVTICLALGVQRMLKRRAIVRKLPAVETLGCATVICSDKTGTLTQNKMTVEKIYVDGKYIDVTGEGYIPSGQFLYKNSLIKNFSKISSLKTLLEIGAICNNSKLLKRGMGSLKYDLSGDPTDGALNVCSQKAKITKEKILEEHNIYTELPFDSDRKMMSVILQKNNNLRSYTKGAPDIILSRCSKILSSGSQIMLTDEKKEEIEKAISRLASQGYRTLALSYKSSVVSSQQKHVESNMVFVGLAAIFDPPRPEVFSAVAKCKSAGIKTVMITGDHKATAVSIAKQLKILPPYGKVLTGSELNQYSFSQLMDVIDDVYVFARVSPEHKLKIVKALKQKGHTVAMTGDGVNDGPAIKAADIGIAMGITGTEVTKEAASLILSDDNFATIVEAVEEGRSIYDNIRKFIRFLLSCNVGEIMTMFLAMLMGLPLPLKPIQILWINLVTDGFPALALGVEKPEGEIMKRKPRRKNQSVFSDGLDFKIFSRGIMISIITLSLFIIGYRTSEGNLEVARTMAFVSLIVTQLVHVFDCRSERKSIFEMNIFSNIYLVIAVLFSTMLMLAVIYVGPLQAVFSTVPLSLEQWLMITGVVAFPYLIQFVVVIYRIVTKKAQLSYTE